MDIEEKRNKGQIQRCRERQKRGVREFNERIPTDMGTKLISSADQIAEAAGAAPLLVEEEEEERFISLCL